MIALPPLGQRPRPSRGAGGSPRLETTRRYSLPSAADHQAAMDALELELIGRDPLQPLALENE
jgi:hypothetical protein